MKLKEGFNTLVDFTDNTWGEWVSRMRLKVSITWWITLIHSFACECGSIFYFYFYFYFYLFLFFSFMVLKVWQFLNKNYQFLLNLHFRKKKPKFLKIFSFFGSWSDKEYPKTVNWCGLLYKYMGCNLGIKSGMNTDIKKHTNLVFHIGMKVVEMYLIPVWGRYVIFLIIVGSRFQI